MGKYTLPYSKEDIARMYREAKNKQHQVKILAQLNDCSNARIYQILEEQGITPELSQKKENRGRKPKSAKEEIIERTEPILEGARKEEKPDPWLSIPPILANEIIEERMRGIEEEIRYHKQIIQNSLDIIMNREALYRELAGHLQEGASK